MAHGHPHHAQRPARRLRSHHVLAAVALVLALAWLAWNALLVESDVAQVADQARPAAAPSPAR